MILILDNYDSFTYNIYQCVTQLGFMTEVIRNDAVDAATVAAAGYEAVILSPGPGIPADAGITKEVISLLAGKVPILGVCLGHQAIAEVFGAAIIRAPLPVHGKVSPVYHNGQGIYAGLNQPFVAGRYHSLLVDQADFPECLMITAQTEEGLIMSLKHKEYNVQGVQFHPESVLTANGIKVFENFLNAV